jgi:lipoprotein-releasing system ATP-binding protein
MSSKVLEFKNVYKSYLQAKNQISVLENISFYLEEGEVVAIVGASGSGKSTLLHIAGLLDRANCGDIVILSKNAAEMKESQKDAFRLKNLGFIYQYHHLLPDFTALENILMPTIIIGENQTKALIRAKSLMEKLGIQNKMSNLPGELSGGEQQRVAIARAMINNPKIILADEPTGNLDNANALQVFELMQDLALEQKTAVLLATHSMELANKVQKILMLRDRELQ